MKANKIVIINLDDALYSEEVVLDKQGKSHKSVYRADTEVMTNVVRKGIILVALCSHEIDRYLTAYFEHQYTGEYNIQKIITELKDTYRDSSPQIYYIGIQQLTQLTEHDVDYCMSPVAMEDTIPCKPDFIKQIEGLVGDGFVGNALLHIDEQFSAETQERETNTATDTDVVTTWNQVKETVKKILRKSPILYEFAMPFIYYKDPEYGTWKKQIKHYGDLNQDKTFYLIRTHDFAMGPLSCCFFYLDQIMYAIKRGYEPIVDLKNYYLPLWQDVSEQYQKNAFDTYFHQQCSTSLEEVYQSKNVVLSWFNGHSPTDLSYEKYAALLRNKHTLFRYHQIVHQYFPFNEEMSQYIQKQYKTLFPSDGKVLGIETRRGMACLGMLKAALVAEHPIQAEIIEIIADAKQYMQKWECQYIFVCTDDREFLQIMQKEFGHHIIYLERRKIRYFKHNLPNLNVTEMNVEFLDSDATTRFQNNRDYFTEVALLARCNSIISPMRSTASWMAKILKGVPYEHIKEYDKGEY